MYDANTASDKKGVESREMDNLIKHLTSQVIELTSHSQRLANLSSRLDIIPPSESVKKEQPSQYQEGYFKEINSLLMQLSEVRAWIGSHLERIETFI